MSVVTLSRRPEGAAWTDRFLYGLLVVQIIVGFEFFWTVMVKIVRGGFVSGLATELDARVKAAPAWYATFAHDVVIPNASVFGSLIIAGELFVGVTLIAAAIVWMAGWDRLGRRGRMALAVLSLLAALAALAMNLNYHISDGGLMPWQLGRDLFDEAVDLNMVLVMIDTTLAVVMGSVVVSLIRQGRQAEAVVDEETDAVASQRLAA